MRSYGQASSQSQGAVVEGARMADLLDELQELGDKLVHIVLHLRVGGGEVEALPRQFLRRYRPLVNELQLGEEALDLDGARPCLGLFLFLFLTFLLPRVFIVVLRDICFGNRVTE